MLMTAGKEKRKELRNVSWLRWLGGMQFMEIKHHGGELGFWVGSKGWRW